MKEGAQEIVGQIGHLAEEVYGGKKMERVLKNEKTVTFPDDNDTFKGLKQNETSSFKIANSKTTMNVIVNSNYDMLW